MLKKASILAGIALGSLMALPLLAGPIVDKATEIEGLVAADDSKGAVDAAAALFGTVWDGTKDIGIHQTVLVTEPAAGFGIFNPRADEKFKVGEPILIYAEPFGFGYGSGGDGLYTIGFTVDLKVSTEAGEVLGEIPGLANLDLTSRYQNREFQANVQLLQAQRQQAVELNSAMEKETNATKKKELKAKVDEMMAKLAREHNDANVLALGSRIIGIEVARDCMQQFLNTEFAGGRHSGRVAKLSNLSEVI